ncbi:PREDICTED: aromatic-L-amino-acid decarboxylase [Nicrophorus vespilloides]|uniref:Aromatic-L-amino-acid decarboxylase n=1 Tax=Nicrophorus vespilloides TaxID=110193 RepID=A0ABM1MQM4_NICVS|nr:PREDICTED: aromatic-L-amino-acid decarboxylase [Nicrophorus vespilloides]
MASSSSNIEERFKINSEMESAQFKDFAKEMIDYVSNYLENIRDRRVLPSVEPGYLRPLIPETAPEKPDNWEDVVTHWHSPRFHAYFPTANSYPAIVADILSGAIACIGFSWIASPACTELEVVMLDWLGKMLDLPKEFLACSGGKGGGVIQGTASEATLVALLGAKARAISLAKQAHPEWKDSDIISKLVAYSSSQSHSSVERAGLLGGVTLKSLKPDSSNRLRGETVEQAIKEDIEAGLIPFYVVATLGTTSSCTFDNLDEIGPVCNANNVWLHVDAAYAGSAFICPEFRYLMKGIERADSFNFNPHKWLLVNFDCSAMWLKDPSWLVNAFNVDPLYLQHDQQGSAPDYRHWQIQLGRRFRSLKLWFVLRLYGIENLQTFIRKHVALAHHFESLVRKDDRFEITEEVIMGLVCFRLRGKNEISENLLKNINARGVIHLVPSKINDVYFLRLAICSRYTETADIELSWNEIKVVANEVLSQ